MIFKDGLFTDLYELTMAQVYLKKGMDKTAVFNFYIRPTEKRPFFVASGIKDVVDYLLNIQFTKEDIDYLQSLSLFDTDFLQYLKNFQFKGNVYAVEEGEIVFPNEPILQVEAPLIQAQVIETFIINALQLPTMITTKAVRNYISAQGTFLVEFGLRRAQGTDAGIKASRSAYIGGFVGTSNLVAGREYGIPVYGTMAHSYILAHNSEEEAFRNYLQVYPKNSILLIDTYDPIQGVLKAVKVVKQLGLKEFKGVRIDSGDIVSISKKVREILNREGFPNTLILVSGGINEYKIQKILQQKAPVDGWGVGTELVVSADVPYLDCVYKLVEYNGRPVMKLSTKKQTLPMKKQVYREYRDGIIHKDTVACFNEKLEGKPLLKQIIKNGKQVYQFPSLQETREKALKGLQTLPPDLKDINSPKQFLPEISNCIQEKIRKIVIRSGI